MKRLICGILITAIFLASATSVEAKTIWTTKEARGYMNKVATYQKKKMGTPSFGEEWTIISLAAANKVTKTEKEQYAKSLEKKLVSCDGELSKTKYTEYSRVVIALSSIGYDATKFCGYNLVAPLGEYDNVVKQGINGAAYALIALDSGGYKVSDPDNYDYQGKKSIRDKLVNSLLRNKLKKGGWTMGKKVDPDITAIVIQALAPYLKDKEVKRAVDQGLTRLCQIQNKDGDFSSYGKANCESTAQVIIAMTMTGVKVSDPAFIKKGNTVLDGLMKYYVKDKKAFKHLENTLVNRMSTDQAMCAIASYYMKQKTGKSIYSKKKIKKKKRKSTIKKKHKKKEEATTKKIIYKVETTKHKKLPNRKKHKKDKHALDKYLVTTKKGGGAKDIIAQEKDKKELAAQKRRQTIRNVAIGVGVVSGVVLLAGGGYIGFRRREKIAAWLKNIFSR